MIKLTQFDPYFFCNKRENRGYTQKDQVNLNLISLYFPISKDLLSYSHILTDHLITHHIFHQLIPNKWDQECIIHTELPIIIW